MLLASPLITRSCIVRSPSPRITKSTCECESNSSGISVGWYPPRTVIISWFFANCAISKPSLCSVADIEIPTKSGLSSSKYFSIVCWIGLGSISKSIMLTSSTSFSIYAAIYSNPVGIISNAKERPCLPDGLISRTFLNDIFTSPMFSYVWFKYSLIFHFFLAHILPMPNMSNHQRKRCPVLLSVLQ